MAAPHKEWARRCGKNARSTRPRASRSAARFWITGCRARPNSFGIKAGGEGGCTPALAVVVSAILDALAPLGVHDITMPATPFKVWQAIRDAKKGSGADQPFHSAEN